jgi:diguanylate cyclase (GGDEF)-like protein/PAS domain S-box-containing protein
VQAELKRLTSTDSMNPKRLRIRFSLSTILPLLLLSCGWYSVGAQSRSLEASTVATYQKTQLEVARNAARAAHVYLARELELRPQAVHSIQQEALEVFVKPIQNGSVSHVWIHSSQQVVLADRAGLSILKQSKKTAELDLLHPHEARHAELITQAVKQGREGVGWYVVQPNLHREALPWWEFLTHDAGHEIAAWSPVVDSETDSPIWVIGISAMLPELMQESGAYTQIQTSILTMSLITLVLLALLVALRRSRANLKASEARYRAIVEDQLEMICRFRADGKLTFVNQAYANTFGITPENLAKANVFDLIPQPELPKVLSQLAALSPSCPVQISERQMTTTDQQVRWQQWIDRAILNNRGQIVEIQSVGRDITNRKLYEAEIERLAFTDPLTGLVNRRRFYDIGQNCLSEMLPRMALIYLDLDRFKPINDTLGHNAGDELLIQVAARLRSCIRREDILARLGGDEFAILLTDSDLKEAKMVGDRILVALNQPFHVQDHTVHLGGSLGIATTTFADMPFSQLLTQADIAMYRAKAQGRSSYVIFDTNMYAAGNRAEPMLNPTIHLPPIA